MSAMANSTFGGLCVLALESRRAREIAKLIANLDGVPLIAPSVREVSLESNREALEFARKLAANEVDMVIFTTGVGVKALASAVETACSRDELSRYLNAVTIVARGPKPTAALRELGVRVSVSVPEPNTWRDLLVVLDQNKDTFPLSGRRVAVQEYGVTNPELSAGLEARERSSRRLACINGLCPKTLALSKRLSRLSSRARYMCCSWHPLSKYGTSSKWRKRWRRAKRCTRLFPGW